MTAIITFRAKPETVWNMDGTVAYRRLKVPAFEARHCNMQAFRSHRRIGPYANSDLFASVLRRETAHLGDYIRLDRPIPGNVTLTDGFLTTVTIVIQ